MLIVILDGYTANPGDLSWAELEALAPCSVVDKTDAHAVIPGIGAAEIVLTTKTPLPGDVPAALPHLKLISVLGTGYNVVEVAAAKADHPLIAAKHCVITPHIAWATRAARRRLISTSADTIAAFLAATQQHVVT
jgi:glycerate dehydrogenase